MYEPLQAAHDELSAQEVWTCLVTVDPKPNVLLDAVLYPVMRGLGLGAERPGAVLFAFEAG